MGDKSPVGEERLLNGFCRAAVIFEQVEGKYSQILDLSCGRHYLCLNLQVKLKKSCRNLHTDANNRSSLGLLLFEICYLTERWGGRLNLGKISTWQLKILKSQSEFDLLYPFIAQKRVHRVFKKKLVARYRHIIFRIPQ